MSMDQLLQKAQAMREKQQRELSETFARGEDDGGTVTAKMDGHRHLRSIHIDPTIVDPNALGALQQNIMDAINQATEEMDEILTRKFGQSTGISELL